MDNPKVYLTEVHLWMGVKSIATNIATKIGATPDFGRIGGGYTYRSDPIQRCTSAKYTFGWSILGCTPRRGALGDTQRNLGPFFLGLTTLLVFLGAVVLRTLLEQST